MYQQSKDNTEDQNSFGKRLIRYGKVSGAMAGLATKLAGDRFFGLTIEKDQHAEELLQALGNLKGPLMKVRQILATIPEALPAEYAQAFQQLQSNAPSMGWPFVRRRMRSELGPEWQTSFASFDQTASAAASLGQVHKATLSDGTILACKLQYPDMESVIQADLEQLKFILSIYGQYDKAIQTHNIFEELSARLYEELDYEREAKHCRLYQDILQKEDGVHVPEVIEPLSTKRLLTTTWLEGNKILSYVDAPLEQRNTLAMHMFRAWYVPLYFYGIIHGDPHLGNYTVRKDDTINLLDFGCVRIFPPRFIEGVITLYHALRTNDTDRAVHAYESWGFHDLSKDYIETLNIWANFLYAPVLDDSVRTIGEVSGGVYGRETAAKVHEQLRELSKQSGGVAVPREFVFMDRAALGLGSVFLHLKAEMNWHTIFHELIDDFDVQRLEQRQADILQDNGLQINA